jgi:hypothetical protein
MYKKILKVSIILIIYVITFILFIAIFGVNRIEPFLDECIQNGEDVNIGYVFITSIKAGIINFFIMLAIAIWAKFSKKIDNVTKTTLYFLPILTFIFTLPAIIPACMVVNFFELL